MHRQRLLLSLEKYAGQYPEESSVVGQFRNLVQNHPDCFSRHCLPGHITGSAWLLDAPHTRLLMTHHGKLDRWLQLGGHSDDDPDTLRVACREAEEESGLSVRPLQTEILDIDVHEIPAHGREPAHRHFDIRYVLVSEGEAFTISPESKDLAWVPLEELMQYTEEESILRMRRKWFDLNV